MHDDAFPGCRRSLKPASWMFNLKPCIPSWTGRLGIGGFILGADGVLRNPLLYLSLYLKTHRADYYRLLQEVREQGAWEAWLEFFLTGVAETPTKLLKPRLRSSIFSSGIVKTSRAERSGWIGITYSRPPSAAPVYDRRDIGRANQLTPPTVNAAVLDLQRLGIVEEVTGRRRGRVFGYRAYLDLLN